MSRLQNEFIFRKTQTIPPEAKMSAFRSFPAPEPRQVTSRPRFEPSYRRRDTEERRREQEKKAAEEQERKKLEMNQTNFPSLGGSAVATSSTWAGDSFAQKAKDWKKHEEVQKIRDDMKRRETERDRMMNSGIFVYRPRHRVIEELEEEEEEEVPVQNSDGWTDVSKKTIKKKHMTDAELERYYSQAVNEDGEEEDYNAELADVDQRREFY
jgi:hypothetical protein